MLGVKCVATRALISVNNSHRPHWILIAFVAMYVVSPFMCPLYCSVEMLDVVYAPPCLRGKWDPSQGFPPLSLSANA
jgi:hypothetical protein